MFCTVVFLMCVSVQAFTVVFSEYREENFNSIPNADMETLRETHKVCTESKFRKFCQTLKNFTLTVLWVAGNVSNIRIIFDFSMYTN